MTRPAESDERPGPPLAVLLVTAVLVVAVVLGVVVWQRDSQDLDVAGCGAQDRVAVTVAPELEAAVRSVFTSPTTVGVSCAQAFVRVAEPSDTLADILAGRSTGLPDIWVPDDTTWPGRAPDAGLQVAGTMATTPLVLASSRAVVDRLGWTTTPPTWGQALQSGVPIAFPPLGENAESLAALAAMFTSLGGGDVADESLVSTVLASARGNGPQPVAALEQGRLGDADAPLVPVTEQQVLATGPGSQLVAVYPADGAPRMQAPVVQVGDPTGPHRAAVSAVVAALTSSLGRSAAASAGFRDVSGTAPPGAGSTSGVLTAEPAVFLLNDLVVQGILDELAKLAAPSRLLAVVDSSASMSTPAGDGTRATLARDAATNALALLPGASSIGAWLFAYRLQGDQDYQEISPIRRLDEEVDGETQRDFLDQQLQSLPSRLTPGGTALYDTTLAAVRAAREAYDPAAVNSVVIITDGRNEDSRGISLPQLLTTLRAEVDPNRPVQVIAVGLGPDADIPALGQITQATGGGTYAAVDPRDLESVLIDALRRRS